MDFVGLTLQQALNVQQFAQLVRHLGVYNLAIELWDWEGNVVLSSPVDPLPCRLATSSNGCVNSECQQERQELWARVRTESQVCTRQCVGQCTLVGIPIRPFATLLGVLLARQAPLYPPMLFAPQPGASVTRPDSGDLMTLLTTLLERSITATIQQLEIDNLAGELLERYEQLTFLFDLGRHINPAEEPAHMLRLVTDKTAQLYGVPYVVTLFYEDTLRQVAVTEPSSAPPIAVLAEAAQRLCQRVAPQAYAAQRPIVLADLGALGHAEVAPMYTAILAVPISVEEHAYGTLNILSMGATRPFMSSDMALAELVSKQIGIFLENHRLYQRLKVFHQSQKMEALGQLAGNIAHDFNNVLSAILGYGDLTRDDLPEGSPARDNLDLMLKAGQHGKALVQQILAFSRQRTAEPQAVSLAFITQEVLALLRVSMPDTIEIRQDLPPMGGVVLGDPTQLHQVVMNLCTNALHAMSESGGVLAVRLAEVQVNADFAAAQGIPRGTYARLTVEDTGCGMSPEILKRIFEPFFTTKAAGKGTGMGLSMVYGLVQSHTGTLTVSSTPGQGTTVDVFLPSLRGHTRPAGTDNASPLPEATPSPLVAADQRASREEA